MASEDSGELFAMSLDGQANALNSLIDHYRPYLVQLAREKLDSAVSPRLDASDVVQQTCLEIYRDFPGFRGKEEGQFIGWIKQVLNNNLANAFRHHVRAQKRTTDKEQQPRGTAAGAGNGQQHFAAKQSTPSARAIRGEALGKLKDGLNHLPPDQLEAVRLRHLEGWSLQQLAKHFGRSEVAVAGLLKRGMQKLRIQMAESE